MIARLSAGTIRTIIPLLLAGTCLGDAAADEMPASIRRIYVPAASRSRWPAGDWEPIPLAQLEQQIAAARNERGKTPVIGLDRAEYRARLLGHSLQGGTFEWKPRRTAAGEFLPLGVVNLSISRIDWTDVAERGRTEPVVWGTTPDQSAGLILSGDNRVATGSWSLTGRRLARSTEFDLQVPTAMVTTLSFEAPEGMMPTVSAGELSGPHPSAEMGTVRWELNLGSRTSCRLRFSVPPAETVRRPLLVARNRTNYAVRPEVLRVVAEFDLEAYEASVRELRLEVDEGLEIVGVEYGDDEEVPWRIVEGSEGHAIVVTLSGLLEGPGPVLRVRAISPGNSLPAWTMPRIYLPDAVESEAQVTLRLIPPFRAADLMFDGYRQIEFVASPTDGETVVLRQLKAGATLAVVTSRPSLAAQFRSVALARLDGDEWLLAAQLDLTATMGSAFEVICGVPVGWEVVNVQGAGESNAGELVGWNIVVGDEGSHTLQLDFAAALSPMHPQRVRITARRNPIDPGGELPVPTFQCAIANEVEATTVIVAGPEQRPVLLDGLGWEMATFAEIAAVDQGVDFLKGLPAASRAAPFVLRTNVPGASGSLVLRSLDSFGAEALRGNPSRSTTAAGAAEAPAETPSGEALAVAVHIEVEATLEGAKFGFDRYLTNLIVQGPEGAELRWVSPDKAENVIVRLDGRAVVPQADGSHQSVRLPVSAVGPKNRHRISMEYRVPSARTMGPNRRSLAVPSFEAPCLGCRVRVMVPHSLRLVDRPGGMDFVPERPTDESRFGPLARSAAGPVFHPFSFAHWSRLREQIIRGDRALLRQRDGDDSPREGEAGGEMWIGASLAIPDSIELTTWDRQQFDALLWVVLSLSLLATVAARMTARFRQRLIGSAGFAATAGLAAALPPLYAQLAGTALIGLTVGVLLPQRLLALRPVETIDRFGVPSGSTRSFAIGGALLIFAALSVAVVVSAQDQFRQSTEPTGVVPAADERIDVLIPVGAREVHAPQPSVGYVSAEVLKRLNRGMMQRALPPYLLNAASLNAQIASRDEVVVQSSFDVFVLSEEETVRVELPLTNVVLGGADACLVDGRSHTIVPGPEGRGLVVELPGRSARPEAVPIPTSSDEELRPPADAPGFLDRESGGSGARSSEHHRIELRLNPLVELESRETVVARIGIPAVCHTIVRIDATNEVVELSVSSPEGERMASASSGDSPKRLFARMSATREVQLRWTRSREAVRRSNVELTSFVSSLVDLSPALALTTYQVEYQVHSGAIDAVTWKLPVGSTLASVRGLGLSGYVIESSEEGGRRLFIEFATPQTGRVILTAILAQPLPRGLESHDLPLLELDDSRETGVHSTFGRYLVAFQPSVDFHLSVGVSAAGAALKPRMAEDFLNAWQTAETRPPQQVFELSRASPLKLSFQELPTGLTARTESRGWFERGRLEWTFVADIEPPAVPPFHYRLQVDPRLHIRNVSVQEEGADRLLRWSRSDDRLVLFLNDRAVQAQSLRIEASLPLENARELDLPSVELEGCSAGPTQLTLGHSAGVRIHVLGPDGKVLMGEGATAASAGARSPVGGESRALSIDVPIGSPPPRVRIEETVPEVSAEEVTMLRGNSDGNVLTSAVEYQVRGGGVLQFEVELPAEFPRDARVETSLPVQSIRQPEADGRTRLVLFPLQPVADRFRVTIKAPIVVPAAGELSVPLVSAVGVRVNARYLLMTRAHSVQFTSAPLPVWSLLLFDSEFDAARAACYRLPDDEETATVRIVEDRRAEPVETLADILLEVDSRGRGAGRCDWWLPEQLPESLVFDWPEQAEPIAVLIDDAPQSFAAPNHGEWTLPVKAESRPKRLRVLWIDRRADAIARWEMVRRVWPSARSFPVAKAIVTTRLSSRLVSRMTAGGLASSEVDSALDRWQTGLAAIERASGRERDADNAWLMDFLSGAVRDTDRLLSRTSFPIDSDRLARQVTLRERTAAIQLADVGELKRAGDASPESREDEREANDASARTSVRLEDGASIGAGQAEEFIVLDRRILQGAWGLCAAFLAALLVWKTARFWHAVQQRASLAWIALGLFWWLVLVPSAFGLALIMCAALAASRKSADEAISLSMPEAPLA